MGIGIIAAVVGLAIGFGIAKMLEKGKATQILGNAKKEAGKIIEDAKKEGENIKKDKIFQAKEKFLELKESMKRLSLIKTKKLPKRKNALGTKNLRLVVS